MFPDKQNVQNYAQMPVPSRRSHSFFIAFLVASALFLAAASYAAWQYVDTADLKTDFDAEVSTAVEAKTEEIRSELQAEFDDEAKSPFRTAKLAESLGTIRFKYPKTWSVYAVEKDSSSRPLQVYAHPGVVPDIQGDIQLAFRIEITDVDYDDVTRIQEKQVTAGKASSRPYKSNGVLGLRFDGAIDSKTSGTLMVFPLRDKTIKLWTESSSYRNDFIKVIESLKFQP